MLLAFLLLFCVGVSADGYDNDVYCSLVKYAYISKMSYCIDTIVDGQSLAEPFVVSPRPYTFLQSGYDENDYYGLEYDRSLKLQIAKLVHPVKDDDSGSQGFFAIDHSGNDSIILSLRGTANLRDYLTDFNVNTIDYEPVTDYAKKRFEEIAICDNCRVHNGFYKRFKEISEQIFPTIEKLVKVFPDYRIVATGHSMGGSLANLIGLELSLIGYKPLIITYGSPKVSNENLSNFMDKMFFTEELFDEDIIEEGSLNQGSIRVVHKDDLIPLFPPGNNFVQSGFEFFIDKEGLPHPKSAVKYNGKAKYIEHEINFNFWDLLTLNRDKIFHLKEHSQYFYPISSCDDIKEETIKQPLKDISRADDTEEMYMKLETSNQ